MDLGLRGKVAIVGGGSAGLGRGVAGSLAAEGAALVLVARGKAELARAASELRAKFGVAVLEVASDLSDPASAERIVSETLREFSAVHILVNNSGGPPTAPFEQMTDELWQTGFELTMMSAVRLMRAVLPHMRKQRWGRIVTINSIAGKQPIPGGLLSSTYRPGLIGLSKALTAELAKDGILINNVCPGFVMTEKQRLHTLSRAEAAGLTADEYLVDHVKEIPLGRYGEPEEIGDFVAFLASERASYVTGAAFSVDGGMAQGLL